MKRQFMALVAITSLVIFSSVAFCQEGGWSGVITGSGVKLREGPGIEYDWYFNMAKGKHVEVLYDHWTGEKNQGMTISSTKLYLDNGGFSWLESGQGFFFQDINCYYSGSDYCYVNIPPTAGFSSMTVHGSISRLNIIPLDHWWKIICDGRVGWVADYYIWWQGK